MLCVEPINLGTRQVPCGTCRACLINRRRDWTARLLLEQAGHAGTSAFVTLTYRDEDMAYDSKGNAVLSREHLRWFTQRLRRAVGKVRYAVVGEYGEKYRRPHYHGIIFAGAVDLREVVARCWDKGFVDVGEVSEASIVYTVSYVLKEVDDESFAVFSEGLGTAALSELRRVARPDESGQLLLPREFRLNGKLWPVPKYLRNKLFEEGFAFHRSRDEVLEEAFVQAVRAAARSDQVVGITEYRKDRALVVAGRRARARARLSSNVAIRRKYETLKT